MKIPRVRQVLAVVAATMCITAASPASAWGHRGFWGPRVGFRVGFYGGYYAPYWAYYGPGWYGYPPYPRGYYLQPSIPSGVAAVELKVNKKKATVLIDGNIIGEARDYDSSEHPLWLGKGVHHLELQLPGYSTLKTDLDVEGGRAYQMHYTLEKGGGSRVSPK